jgi:N-acetylglucosaminyl-diphospho-decaprenol L-rhamnosyltransferase
MLIETMTDLSIIIVNYNGLELTRNCLLSIAKIEIACLYEIILVDNASTDDSVARIAVEFPQIKMIASTENKGFGYANNVGAREAKGRYLFFLNNDTLLTTDFLSPAVAYLDVHAVVGILGPKLLNADGTFQLSAGRLPGIAREMKDKILYFLDRRSKNVRKHLEQRYSSMQAVEWVTGAALFIRASVFTYLDGFDEHFFMFFEDKDLCKRCLDHSMQIIYHPQLSLIHLRGGSVNEHTRSLVSQYYRQSQNYYYQKHRSSFEQTILAWYLANQSLWKTKQ